MMNNNQLLKTEQSLYRRQYVMAGNQKNCSFPQILNILKDKCSSMRKILSSTRLIHGS